MSNTYEHILVSYPAPAIAMITLHRPDVYNALNVQMVGEIVEAIKVAEASEEVRVIVLQGNDRAFAAGADIHEMAHQDPITLDLLNQFAVWDEMRRVKKPIIAAVKGYALGGGFELALTCDFIFASDDAHFGFPEVNIGIMPGAGGTQRLTKALGKVKAMEWLCLGEQMTAKEACDYGVINHVYPKEALAAEVLRFANTLATKPPLSLRFIKEAVQTALDYPLDEGLALERKNFYLLFSSQDQKEGMQAFIEKRKPLFKGR
ncbi:enoyl-CoA hydratase/isomerase family protein [Massilibacterium senegalense]|uniref:enoyl-CoA hydratase/isomerase family protein n=1 Tax=Massilibacterium senegalense TaxID=1632858 RepID=UPI0007809279|nr:enoyl-CoA hydratase-related protein [Massilibacterium senegalense]